MKKIILSIFLVLSSLSFSLDFKIKSELPENIEKEIRSAVSSHSSSDKKEYYNWYKDAYIEMIKRIKNSNIPEQDAQVIVNRLHSMYGANYPKQLASLNGELEDYKNLVQRIRQEQMELQQKIESENEKNKKEIKEIFENTNINIKDLENIELNAKKEYPENYSLQKAYIKGAIQIYQELKNMIKK